LIKIVLEEKVIKDIKEVEPGIIKRRIDKSDVTAWNRTSDP